MELLESFGYACVSPEDLDGERASFRETILTGRLAAVLKRLNPWLSATNVASAVKAVTQVPAASLAEANRKIYTSLTYGIALEQDRGDVGDKLGRKPSPQDILLYGLLEPRNLLDIVRNFVVFEAEGGRTVRKLTRYKQFMAVNQALRRIRTARKPSERGGIVWHTQGSGKSLTMLWLALKLRRDQAQQQPTVVIVTDRTKLDRQIAGVFTACGFPNPERAESVKDLRRILEHPTGKTVMIQKFQEIAAAAAAGRRAAVHPTLSEAASIFVMVDEAHRTRWRRTWTSCHGCRAATRRR